MALLCTDETDREAAVQNAILPQPHPQALQPTQADLLLRSAEHPLRLVQLSMLAMLCYMIIAITRIRIQ